MNSEIRCPYCGSSNVMTYAGKIYYCLSWGCNRSFRPKEGDTVRNLNSKVSKRQQKRLGKKWCAVIGGDKNVS